MKKNVAILIQHLGGGGAERVAINLANSLPEEKYNKYLIVYDSSISDYFYEGMLIDLEVKSTKGILGKGLNLLKRIYRLYRVKKEYKIDITISLLSSANIVNILSKRNDKVIISVRNYISKSSKGIYGTIDKALIKLLYNKANTTVAVSEDIKADLINKYKINSKKVKVINNFYNIEEISCLSRENVSVRYNEIFKCPTIITAGRLSNQKGHWHLIRAFKNVKEEVPNAKLLILGKGELEEYLKGLIKKYGLEDDVIMVGFKKNPFKYISKAKAYVFPSLYEGFPNALCEAMACGLPVISTDCKSGPREILDPINEYKNQKLENFLLAEYGILVPTCDGKLYEYNDYLTEEEKVLSRAIIQILKDTDLKNRYSEKSLKRVLDFNEEAIMKKWDDLLST